MLIPKLRFKEFTDEWEETKINDIAFLTSSKRIYLSDYTNNGIPFYRGKEISELKKGKKVSDLLYIDEMKYNDIKEKYGIPKENDILITAVGTLANIYRIPNNEKFYFKDGNLIWFKNIKCDSKFLEYLLEYNKKLLLDSCIGSTQKALTIVGINKIIMNFPNVNEQTKISKVIQLIDKKIELQTKKIEVLKLYSESTKHQIMFIKDNTKKEYKLSDLLHEENCKSTVNNQYPILSSTNKGIFLQEEYFNKQAASTDNIGYKILKKNQLVFSPQNLWMGNININFKYDIGIVSPSYKIFNVNDSVCDINYFNEWIKTKEALYSYILASEQGASVVRRNLNIDLFNEILILLPDDNKQKEYGKLFNTINNKLQLENTKLLKLIELKKGLMQQLFV